MSGTFQLANQARTFAGNNVGTGQQLLEVIDDAPVAFDGANDAGLTATILGYSGSTVTIQAAESEVLDWYFGAMVFYETTGAASSGLTDETTYFIGNFTRQGGTDLYSVTLSGLPNEGAIQSLQLGSGTETLTQIGVSADKDILHIKNHGLSTDDMVRYTNDAGGFASDQTQNFYFVQTRYDQHNIQLTHTLGEVTPLTQSRIGTDSGVAITPTTVTATGFIEPISWAVTSGALPTGLSLNTTTGIVSGTPNEVIASPGRDVVITVTDAAGSIGSQTITFQFNQPPNLYNFTSATFTPGGRTGRFGPNATQARNGVGNPSWASSYLTTSSGIQYWTVPQTATYRIEAAGAEGGRNNSYSDNPGRGARMRGDFQLTQGEVIRILVGQQGVSMQNTCGAAGGGGGTFVTQSPHTSTSNVLVAAGGGGGVGTTNRAGINGTTSTAGTRNNGNNVNGGSNGNGGAQAPGSPCNTNYIAGSGGGFLTSGGGPQGGPSQNGNTGGGNSYLNGGAGGDRTRGTNGSVYVDGGFGGGGMGNYGAGAGGGYSGGGAGQGYSCNCSTWSGGGGGGSVNNGSNQSNSGGVRTGAGYVSITRL